jgi:hypothetical protein
MNGIKIKIIDILIKMQLGCHPVAVVQYTFKHKQYIERHKNFGRVRAVPTLCDLYPGLKNEEETRKNLSKVAEECQLAR